MLRLIREDLAHGDTEKGTASFPILQTGGMPLYIENIGTCPFCADTPCGSILIQPGVGRCAKKTQSRMLSDMLTKPANSHYNEIPI